MQPSEPWITPWKAQKYAGNASVSLGLLGAFASFGLFITRRNDGETHYQWLGTDDYMVMSCLMVGSLLLAWFGRSAYLAGESGDIITNSTNANVRIGLSSTVATHDITRGSAEHRSLEYMQTAYRTLFAASIIFFAISAYAFLGGFHSTPTPESHIGPNQNNKMELSVFCVTYGLTALASLVSAALSTRRLKMLDERLKPSRK